DQEDADDGYHATHGQTLLRRPNGVQQLSLTRTTRSGTPDAARRRCPTTRRLGPAFALALLTAVTPPALAAPVDSDLAVAALGGGCHPTGIQPALLDMLTLINPEWAPVLNGQTVDSTPVLIHGLVQGMHGDTSGDFPSTHLRADVNHFVQL